MAGSRIVFRAGSWAAGLALLLAAAAAAGAPSKQDQQKADKLFREARALMNKGTFEPACPKLEESQKLDPAPGTLYQLAACYEKTGRPATALAFYIEVADLAQRAGFKDKEKVARDNAAALEPKVPRIIIEVPAALRGPGLAVTRDGGKVEESQFDRPILVDPGDITVEATAPGKKPFKSTVSVKGEGTRVTVPVRLEDERPAEPRKPPPPPKSSFGPQRIAGVGVAALGVGGVVVGSVFGLNAKSAYDKAMGDPALCPSKKACYPEGKRLVDGAQTDALISTIGFIAGGVALAGGVVLFVTAPSGGPAAIEPKKAGASLVVLPAAGAGFGGVVAAGEF